MCGGKSAGHAPALIPQWRPMPSSSSVGGTETTQYHEDNDEMAACGGEGSTVGAAEMAIGSYSCVRVTCGMPLER